MKTFILLAMHGAPPKDFPGREQGEYFALHMQVENNPEGIDESQRWRYADLNHRVRSWPRTAANDPFFASSLEMARRLQVESGFPTLVCFNEFCDPRLSNAARTAVVAGAQ